MSFVDSALTAADALVGDVLAPYALIAIPNRYIADIIFDVTVEEIHEDRLEVTQHPIQTGAVVTDHSFALPATLTIRGGSSDSTGGYVGYANDIYQYFLALRDTRQPFQVSTGKRLYDNMLIKDLSTTTDPSSEYALMCTVVLQQLTFTDAGGGSNSNSGLNTNPSTMLSPQETAPTVNVGAQNLGPAITGGLPYFAQNPTVPSVRS